MKKIMKVLSMAMAACMMLTLVTACSSTGDTNGETNSPASTATEESTSEESATESTTEESATEEVNESTFDFSQYPEDFGAWTMTEMKDYLTETGVIGDEKYFGMDMSEGDLEATGMDAGYVYVDTEGGAVSDTICYFDITTESGKEMIDKTIENHAVIVGDDVENGIDMDAVIGGFCFSYTMGTDEDHIAIFAQALKDLAAHYNVEAAYINE